MFLNLSHISGIALCVDNIAWNGAGQKIWISSGINNEKMLTLGGPTAHKIYMQS